MGAKGIPVLLGIDCFAVYVTIEQADRRDHARTDFVGVYDSREAAESGLREWILGWWYDQLDEPWGTHGQGFAPNELNKYLDAEAEWIADKTDQDIINFHFNDHGSQRYRIEEVKLQGQKPRIGQASSH